MPVLPNGILLPAGCTIDGAWNWYDGKFSESATNNITFQFPSGYYSVIQSMYLQWQSPGSLNSWSITFQFDTKFGAGAQRLYDWGTPETLQTTIHSAVNVYLSSGGVGTYTSASTLICELPPIAIPPGTFMTAVGNPFGPASLPNSCTANIDLYPWTQTPEELNFNAPAQLVAPTQLV